MASIHRILRYKNPLVNPQEPGSGTGEGIPEPINPGCVEKEEGTTTLVPERRVEKLVRTRWPTERYDPHVSPVAGPFCIWGGGGMSSSNPGGVDNLDFLSDPFVLPNIKLPFHTGQRGCQGRGKGLLATMRGVQRVSEGGCGAWANSWSDRCALLRFKAGRSLCIGRG